MPFLSFYPSIIVGTCQGNLARLFKGVVQFNPGKLQNGGGSGIGLMGAPRVLLSCLRPLTVIFDNLCRYLSLLINVLT